VNRNVNSVILLEGYRHWTFHRDPFHRRIFTKATESRGLASALLLSSHMQGVWATEPVDFVHA